MIVSLALMLTTDGTEIQFGFWILTNACVFVVQVMWDTYASISKYYANKNKPVMFGPQKEHEEHPSFDGSNHLGNPDYIHIEINMSHRRSITEHSNDKVQNNGVLTPKKKGTMDSHALENSHLTVSEIPKESMESEPGDVDDMLESKGQK